jgi:hypothetical protein
VLEVKKRRGREDGFCHSRRLSGKGDRKRGIGNGKKGTHDLKDSIVKSKNLLFGQ